MELVCEHSQSHLNTKRKGGNILPSLPCNSTNVDEFRGTFFQINVYVQIEMPMINEITEVIPKLVQTNCIKQNFQLAILGL